jgi:hypothetical protein
LERWLLYTKIEIYYGAVTSSMGPIEVRAFDLPATGPEVVDSPNSNPIVV